MLPPLHSIQTPSLFNPGRYEDEINRRTGAENEFVVLKKVSGLGILSQEMELAYLAEFEQSWWELGSCTLLVGSSCEIGTSWAGSS